MLKWTKQMYYQKMVGEVGEEVAKIIWQRNHWHRLLKAPQPLRKRAVMT